MPRARSTGSPRTYGEEGYTTLERVWTRPTLDVCGIVGGFTGEGSKTILPAWAKAKVSCRLVTDQDPDKILHLVEKQVMGLAPSTVKVEFVKMHGGQPFYAEPTHPAFGAARRSLERAFGRPTVDIREGGSIPFVRTIADILQRPCLLLGFGQPDENAHAPNEWLELEYFHLGIKSCAYLYEELSKLPRG